MDARELQSMGGKARAVALTKEERHRIAVLAGTARWKGISQEDRRSRTKKSVEAMLTARAKNKERKS